MATRRSDDDDAHNPFGPDPAPKRGPEPGVFDPERKSENDPFKQTPDELDEHWDMEEDGPSTRDA